MTAYEETVNFLYSQLPMFGSLGAGAYKPGLDNAYSLSEVFENPHADLECIHIAGTNGKGSTSSMIASVLQEAGYRVGLYTSPHIFDFRERIRINGEMIPESAVIGFVKRFREMDLDCQPSFFELTTIMAFEYFKNTGVDIAVIETGLGGRLDTTNIITPKLSVITNVSIDHVAQLGNTLGQIAGEKAGIIKKGVPVVIGESNETTKSVFYRKAQTEHADIIFAEDTPLEITDNGSAFTFCLSAGYPSCSCDLSGEFQKRNVNTAVHALRQLGIEDSLIASGLSHVTKNTGLKGRWTVLQESSPKIIYDTGHNEGAWRYIAPTLGKMATKTKLSIVIGFVSDKDVDSVLGLIADNIGTCANYYFVAPDTKRAISASSLLEKARMHGLDGTSYSSVAEGIKAATADNTEGTVFIGGSNYVAAEITC